MANKIYQFQWICEVENGMHASAIASLVQDLAKITGNILVMDPVSKARVDGKSVLGLLSLAIPNGMVYDIFYEGSMHFYEETKNIFIKRGSIIEEKERL
jgi:phosphotransferase system HPr-like phosphotransfer protein